ncbi:MAG: TIGR04076 family protein [Clostridia bacterium]|nr:TIGR04076 family protein [Clostridia bacterium]
MKKIKITVMAMVCHKDLIEKYENPIEHACDMKIGQVFVANGWKMPEGFCFSAWDTLSPYVMAMAHGAEDFFDGWMKDKKSAMLSCSDGFRPVTFLLETLDEDAD